MRDKLRLSLVASVLAVALLAVACGGDGKSGEAEKIAGDSAPTVGTEQVSDDQLRTMALPLEAYGDDYSDFDLDDESGFRSNDYEINDATDADKTRARIEQFGRVNGYEDSYSSLTAFTRLEGVMNVGSEITLFGDSEGASGYLQSGPDQVREEAPGGGMTLKDLSAFDPGKIGEEALGMTATVATAAGETTVRMTAVGVRRGRVVGIVALMDDTQTASQDEVIALARKLDDRMVGVLKGDILPGPAPEPTPTEEPEAAGTPAAAGETSPTTALSSFRYASRIEIAVGGGGMAIATSGEFQAPGSMTCTTEISLAGTKLGSDHQVVIGDRHWRDEGAGWQTVGSGLDTDLDLCAGSPQFWSDFSFAGELAGLPGQAETINGTAARRYSVGQLAQTMGRLGIVPTGLEGVSIDRYEIWLAQDGDWLVSLDVDMSADGQALSGVFGLGQAAAGSQGRVTMKIDITDANDPGIQVQAPE